MTQPDSEYESALKQAEAEMVTISHELVSKFAKMDSLINSMLVLEDKCDIPYVLIFESDQEEWDNLNNEYQALLSSLTEKEKCLFRSHDWSKQ